MLTAVDAHLWILLPFAVTLKWSVKHDRNLLLIIVLLSMTVNCLVLFDLCNR